jgi:hypothetical protein
MERNTPNPNVPTMNAAPTAGMNWETLSGKEAKTLDNSELGKVKHVADDYVYTEKGLLEKENFYIPRRFADRFDGKTLWFSITKGQAESEFKREIPPAPGEYAKKYTTVEKRITERTIETSPSGETKESVQEKNA